MRAGDELAARRRQQPMHVIDKDYRFTDVATGDERTLLELFEGRPQLVLYHFMFGPGWGAGCDGCSMMVDNWGHPAHLNARGVTRVAVSRAPADELRAYRDRMGWDFAWYSSYGSDFNYDFGRSARDGGSHDNFDRGEDFGLSVFYTDGEAVYRSYFTDQRGLERFGTNFSFLDVAPFGRQETWESSPSGVPQSASYEWWRRHDEYDAAQRPDCH